jgi:hypothetical protein
MTRIDTRPPGMTEVTKERFYAALRADPRDIMPSNKARTYTTWQTWDGSVWGWSAPGWANAHEHADVYAIRGTTP